jgi:hypothetical protein
VNQVLSRRAIFGEYCRFNFPVVEERNRWIRDIVALSELGSLAGDGYAVETDERPSLFRG